MAARLLVLCLLLCALLSAPAAAQVRPRRSARCRRTSPRTPRPDRRRGRRAEQHPAAAARRRRVRAARRHRLGDPPRRPAPAAPVDTKAHAHADSSDRPKGTRTPPKQRVQPAARRPRRPAARASATRNGDAPADGLAPGPDGRPRCWWGVSTPDYVAYHDEEWGRPVRDEDAVYERLVPRGLPVRAVVADDPAQARGVPRARSPASRSSAVAAFGDDDVERLLGDAGDRPPPRQDRGGDRQRARRRRLHARAARSPTCCGRTRPAPAPGPAVARRRSRATTPESTALSKALKRRGFRFVGPTTLYAAMQACGVVNDHLAGCVARRRRDGPAKNAADR